MLWYSAISNAALISSFVSFLISMFTSGKISHNSLISGYVSLLIGIMMILIIIITKFFEMNKTASIAQLSLFVLGPFLLIMNIVGFMLYLIIVYKESILKNYVTNNYHIFSNITLILLFLQLYIIYTNINTKEFELTGRMSNIILGIMYVIGVITTISVWHKYIILKYYRTDGFEIL